MKAFISKVWYGELELGDYIVMTCIAIIMTVAMAVLAQTDVLPQAMTWVAVKL